MLPRHSFAAGVGVVTIVALSAGFLRRSQPSAPVLERGPTEFESARRTADPPPERAASEAAAPLVRTSAAEVERTALEPVATAAREAAPQPPAALDEAPQHLTPERQKERLEACRAWRREAHVAGGAAEFDAAFYNALFAIAIDLDAQGRATDALGRSVSLTSRAPREHRYVTNGYLYSFDCDEYPGFDSLRKRASSTGGVAADHVPDDVLAALDSWTERALEHLSK